MVHYFAVSNSPAIISSSFSLVNNFLGYFKVFSELKPFFLSNFDIISNFPFIVNSVFLLFFKKVCFCFSVF